MIQDSEFQLSDENSSYFVVLGIRNQKKKIFFGLAFAGDVASSEELDSSFPEKNYYYCCDLYNDNKANSHRNWVKAAKMVITITRYTWAYKLKDCIEYNQKNNK